MPLGARTFSSQITSVASPPVEGTKYTASGALPSSLRPITGAVNQMPPSSSTTRSFNRPSDLPLFAASVVRLSQITSIAPDFGSIFVIAPGFACAPYSVPSFAMYKPKVAFDSLLTIAAPIGSTRKISFAGMSTK